MQGDQNISQLSLLKTSFDERDPDPKFKSAQDKRKTLTKRAYSFAVDSFVIFFIAKSLMFAYFKALSPLFKQLPFKTQGKLLGLYDDFYISVFALTYIGYYFASMVLTKGQTPGKILFGLRVACDIGKEQGPSPFRALARSVSYLTCHMFGVIPLSVPFFTNDSRGVPDWISGTKVKSETEFKMWLSKLSLYENSLAEWNADQPELEFDGFIEKVSVEPETVESDYKIAA